jgi:hypothetical protein
MQIHVLCLQRIEVQTKNASYPAQYLEVNNTSQLAHQQYHSQQSLRYLLHLITL